MRIGGEEVQEKEKSEEAKRKKGEGEGEENCDINLWVLFWEISLVYAKYFGKILYIGDNTWAIFDTLL